MLPDNVMLITSIFLLGTYAVATLDDLIHMRASRSFLYIWGALGAIVAGLRYMQEDSLLLYSLGLALAVGIICRAGILGFKLAWGDIIAMLPAILLLPIVNAILFLALVFVLDYLILRLIYIKLLQKSSYPFMPAITGALLIVLIYTGISDLSVLMGGVA